MKLQAPFPYFGGKSQIAPVIWQYLGDVEHYLEPFFGSGAVLLARPNYDPRRHTETVCDADAYLTNTWRAIKYAPEEVAKYCDNPVNHVDLAARRKYLIDRRDLIEKMIEDPEWYDARLAGYWIWCSSCWIGGGMLTKPVSLPTLGTRPHITTKGQGVNRLPNEFSFGKRPHLADKGHDINKRTLPEPIPHLSHKGMGVNAISLVTFPVNVCDTIQEAIVSWLRVLADRLRLVRVVCGDWLRICGGDWQDSCWRTVGVYFDPPYSSPSRDKKLYHKEDLTAAEGVADWALERGKRENYRIVISAYDDEECYYKLLENGWRIHKWTARGGYANLAKKGKKENRYKEVLYISPYCEKPIRREDRLPIPTLL